ncbi:polyhydroxyalkanoate biosynthesis repressor PhaR [Sporosarcina sp. ACRSM]|uniref:poly(R)-hydroxyalkanoic acid synthase subunit PhaE n=1 Tax=Sporosarcina sp. ACRSM TaxID=2918216 RepID=UPI001EF6DD6F|nr:poly(R)-hydroxyalkanoic acid synthase subunit PhaE [Sporosarcina sp. ACRSM]MCG7334579.1 polyhydroxyalkanoate biosynthesis repressor PhaR [Sporosarcina sp. ACRSM]
MTQKVPFDPFTMWKEIYEKTEASWSGVLQESLGKETFSEGLGQTLNSYLQYQEVISQMTETYLKQVNMPTRGEVSNIASLVINLENKVDDLEDKIDDAAAKEDTSKEINQLKKAVSNLDKKLDKVLTLIEEVNTKPAPAVPAVSTKQ